MDSDFSQQQREHEFYQVKLKTAFLEKTERYRQILTIQDGEILNQSKLVLWEISRDINTKLQNLELQIEQRVNDLACQTQEQLELIISIEQVIEKTRLVSDVPPDQLQQVANILDEGVDKNLQRWENWKKQNVNLFFDEIVQSKQLLKSFLNYQLGNYIGVNNETGEARLLLRQDEEEKQQNEDSVLNKFKLMISGVVNKASSFSIKTKSRRGSTASQEGYNPIEPHEHIQTIKGHLQQVYSCIQLSDESYATSSFDGTVKIWNPEDFKLEYSCPTLQTSFNDIVEITNHKLEENTLLLAAANDDGTIKLYIKLPAQNWGFYKELAKVKEGTPFQLAYDAKHNVLLYNTQRNGRVIQIFDMTTFKLSKPFSHKFSQNNPGTCISLLPIDQRFLTGDLEGYIYKWSYTCKSPLVKIKAHENCINCITILKDFRIISCCQDGLLKVWSSSLLGSKPIQAYEHKYPIWSICATKKYVLTGDVEGNLNYHDLDQFTIRKVIKAHTSGISIIRQGYDPNENKFITSSEDFKSKIWSFLQ